MTKKIRLFLLLQLLLISLSVKESYAREVTVNLQPNEAYTLDLTDYYDDIFGTKFSLSTSLKDQVLVQPFTLEDSKNEIPYKGNVYWVENFFYATNLIKYDTLIFAIPKGSGVEYQLNYYNTSKTSVSDQYFQYQHLVTDYVLPNLNNTPIRLNMIDGKSGIFGTNTTLYYFTIDVTKPETPVVTTKSILNVSSNDYYYDFQVKRNSTGGVFVFVSTQSNNLYLYSFDASRSELTELDSVKDQWKKLKFFDNLSYVVGFTGSNKQLVVLSVTSDQKIQASFNLTNYFAYDDYRYSAKVIDGDIYIELYSNNTAVEYIVSYHQQYLALNRLDQNLEVNHLNIEGIHNITQLQIVNKDLIFFISGNSTAYLYSRRKERPIFAQKLDQQVVFIDEAPNGEIYLGLVNGDKIKVMKALINIPSLRITQSQKDKFSLDVTISGPFVSSALKVNVNLQENESVSFRQSDVVVAKLLYNNSNSILLDQEDYIIGGDLRNVVATSKNPFFKSFRQLSTANLTNDFRQSFLHVQRLHLTQSPNILIEEYDASNKKYLLTIAQKVFTEDGKFQIFEYKDSLQINVESQIDTIDPYSGFFTYENSKSVIYIFSANNDRKFTINRIDTQCSDANMKFAADPNAAVLFVACGNKLTRFSYSISFDAKTPAVLSLSEIKLQDMTGITSLSILKGSLLVASKTNVVIYDYLKDTVVNSFKIPSISTNQQIYFFRSTFVIAYLDDKSVLRGQVYRYPTVENNFQVQYLRQISSSSIDTSVFQTKHIFTAVQNNFEYLLAKNTDKSFSLFPVNEVSSQTQVYPSVKLPEGYGVISADSNAICYLTVENLIQCDRIYKDLKLEVQYAMDSGTFYGSPSHLIDFTLISGDKSTQNYNITILRETHAALGMLNKTDSHIQQVQQYFSSNQWTSDSSFKFDDSSCFNNNLHSWKISDNDYVNLTNKLELQSNNSSSQYVSVVSILGGSKNIFIQRDSISIEQKVPISGNFSNCLILDDEGSVNQKDQNLSFDLYAFCPSIDAKNATMQVIAVTLTLDHNAMVVSGTSKLTTTKEGSVLYYITKLITISSGSDKKTTYVQTIGSQIYTLQVGDYFSFNTVDNFSGSGVINVFRVAKFKATLFVTSSGSVYYKPDGQDSYKKIDENQYLQNYLRMTNATHVQRVFQHNETSFFIVINPKSLLTYTKTIRFDLSQISDGTLVFGNHTYILFSDSNDVWDSYFVTNTSKYYVSVNIQKSGLFVEMHRADSNVQHKLLKAQTQKYTNVLSDYVIESVYSVNPNLIQIYLRSKYLSSLSSRLYYTLSINDYVIFTVNRDEIVNKHKKVNLQLSVTPELSSQSFEVSSTYDGSATFSNLSKFSFTLLFALLFIIIHI